MKTFNTEFDFEKIRIRPMIFSCYDIVRRIGKNEIIIGADLPNHSFWKDNQKSNLIESMFMGISIPSLYFWENKQGLFEVIDGRQRLMAISDFLNDRYKLINLHYFQNCEGLSYQSLLGEYSSRIESATIQVNVVEYGCPEIIKLEIFNRMNGFRRGLTNQEKRNVFSTESVKEVLIKMVTIEEFHKVAGNIKNQRKQAEEIALKFMTLYFFRDSYQKDLDLFLDNSIFRLNGMEKQILDEVCEQFQKGLRHFLYFFNKNDPDAMWDLSYRNSWPWNPDALVIWALLLSKIETSTLKKNTSDYYIEKFRRFNEKSGYNSLLAKSYRNNKHSFLQAFQLSEQFIEKEFGVKF